MISVVTEPQQCWELPLLRKQRICEHTPVPGQTHVLRCGCQIFLEHYVKYFSDCVQWHVWWTGSEGHVVTCSSGQHRMVSSATGKSVIATIPLRISHSRSDILFLYYCQAQSPNTKYQILKISSIHCEFYRVDLVLLVSFFFLVDTLCDQMLDCY